MSRCFPYIPPGCSLGKVGNEALVESIKLQSKTQRVSKEDRKKEKSKDKKRTHKEKKDKTKRHTEKLQADTNSGCFLGNKVAETEQIEKSSLTEEHEQPIYLCVPGSPSDSTGNSSKRKRQASPIDGSQRRGNVIRIRLLPPKKPKDHDITGRTDSPAIQHNEIALRTSQEKNYSTSQGSNNAVPVLPIGTAIGPICSFSGNSAALLGNGRAPTSVDAVMTKIQSMDLQYRGLFDNWVPPQMQAQDHELDQDWLFQGKRQDVHVVRKLNTCSETMACSSGLRPCAQYLPEADVYALPFTVPF